MTTILLHANCWKEMRKSHSSSQDKKKPKEYSFRKQLF